MALVSPPLGATVPASPHATVVSLPTLADVEGYERKDPATLRHITVGYPRFVRNRLVGEAAARAAAALGRTGELFPLVSRAAALAWADRAGAVVTSLDDVGARGQADDGRVRRGGHGGAQGWGDQRHGQRPATGSSFWRICSRDWRRRMSATLPSRRSRTSGASGKEL